MALPKLKVVPAGAGSGKTYEIQQQLGKWVQSGQVAPERIVAVTYTEAAAAELRERISAQLLNLGRVDDALRLAQAYITTIHGFGLRLLTEFAFQAGVSPAPRLLSDDEQSALVRRALARTDKADAIVADLTAYGYKPDVQLRRSQEEVFRQELLHVIGLLRSIGLETAAEARAQAALAAEDVQRKYGAAFSDGPLAQELQRRVRALLRSFPRNLAGSCGTSEAARHELLRDFRNLGRAASAEALAGDWGLWQELRQLRVSKRGAPLPPGYDGLAADVMEAADALPRLAGPLRQAQAHVAALLETGQAVLGHYAEAKRKAGLVDYSDMIATAERLLRQRPDILGSLVGRIDCLVVDEFQDTNPLQFALLWTLREAGVPTLVVGDLKQAIMGFQGADPRLFEALLRNHPEGSDPLAKNWRSQPSLMEFVNAVGPVLFGESYSALHPQRSASRLAPLEIVQFRKRPKKDRHAVRAFAVGQRLQELLEDPSQVIVDRKTGERRRLRGGDLAVLCPTHAILSAYAEVLRALGLQVSRQAEGWFDSRAVQLAWHALAYLANRADRHAALYLAVTEMGSLSLDEGLRQLLDGKRVADPVLDKLDALAEGVADRTIYALVADTLAALDLFSAVSVWPDAEQARANLVRLLAEAGEFMDANREALAHGGYHGSGVQTFLAWLASRAEEDDTQPERRVLEEDAIVLRTWHSAKGLEWPVVAVGGLDRNIAPRLPRLGLGYSSFDDLANVLRNVRTEFTPAFAAPEQNIVPKLDLHADLETENRRLLYVALTRARDKLLLEWPQFLEGKSYEAAKRQLQKFASIPEAVERLSNAPPPQTCWAILEPRCELVPAQGVLMVDGSPFPCRIAQGAAELPDGFALDAAPAEVALPIVGRRAIRPGKAPEEVTPDIWAASVHKAGASPSTPAAYAQHQYGPGLEVDVGLSGMELGSFLHRCFEVLGSRPGLAGRLDLLTGLRLKPEAMGQIAAAVASFEAWLRDFSEVEGVLREWPLLMLDESGSVMSGTADLIVQTPAGVWLWDHKSDQVDDPEKAFAGYRSQLEAYVRALALEGRTVQGFGINWIRRGAAMWLEWPAGTGAQPSAAAAAA